MWKSWELLKHGFLEGIKDNLGRPVGKLFSTPISRNHHLIFSAWRSWRWSSWVWGWPLGPRTLGQKLPGIIFQGGWCFKMPMEEWWKWSILWLYENVHPQELRWECADLLPLHRLAAPLVPTSPSYHKLSSLSAFFNFSKYESLVILWPNTLSSVSLKFSNFATEPVIPYGGWVFSPCLGTAQCSWGM